jgi:hypothetical protein
MLREVLHELAVEALAQRRTPTVTKVPTIAKQRRCLPPKQLFIGPENADLGCQYYFNTCMQYLQRMSNHFPRENSRSADKCSCSAAI